MPTKTQQQFKEFENAVFADGALSAKIKELIAFAAAHITQSGECIAGHARRALAQGATEQELIEAMWVAVVMRAGGSLGGAGEGAEARVRKMTETFCRISRL